ncbi:MAG: threonylcarbamoyl-AMP synthase [Candidatus Aenigmarchaeota archaeon]|nr:threonylcarbamoyl-AMP synthase [Candidatus Aenigmarchaeota archaeon]
MLILTKEDSEKIKELIIQDSVFIYPTDTIYGLGCDATNSEAVQRIRVIKQREEKPFSVIAPSKQWILDNCVVKQDDLTCLPGPYTLIVKINQKCVVDNVNLCLDTLGVRIPKHWFSQVVEELRIPVVTTSANISGQKFMTSIDNLDVRIKKAVDFIVYDGVLDGNPSKIIDLTKGKVSRD